MNYLTLFSDNCFMPPGSRDLENGAGNAQRSQERGQTGARFLPERLRADESLDAGDAVPSPAAPLAPGTRRVDARRLVPTSRRELSHQTAQRRRGFGGLPAGRVGRAGRWRGTRCVHTP